MAQQCPASVDVTDIQFKLQSKHKVFADNGKLRDHVNLLACASNHGILFVGNPNAPEFHAFILPDVIYAKSKGQPVHLRTTKLANIPNTIACNADGSMLAVNYTVQGYGVLEIYHVPSFVASDVKSLYSIRLPDQNVYALHLLWNPVLPTVIGVVLSNGNFVLYTLKDGGAMEMRSIKNQQIQCGCWSPKGKQIVLGHPNGKLQQFKPDLTPVKSIICPPDVHPGPFDTIALHWLSTFQFVVSFLQHGEGAMPNIYIVNAPKGGVPVYINYNDVCYSGSEPRKQQVSFMHISQWNLLLVTSSNGVEIGLLGTKDSTDQPQWVHYMLLDEARIEMPLNESSDETFPIGLALDTSPNHELTVGEKKLQTMPVIHVLSTNGHLLCFNFLNLTPNAVNICSPPAPINYAMAKFSKLDEGSLIQGSASEDDDDDSKNLTLPTIEAPPPAPAFNIQPSNAAISQNLPTFGAGVGVPGGKPMFSGGWEQKPQGVNFSVTPSVSDSQQRNVIAKPTVQTAPIGGVTSATTKPPQPTEVFKPLYTVSPEYAPPPVQQQQLQRQQQQSHQAKSSLLNLSETNSVIQQMIIMQIVAFEKEIKQLGQKSKLVLNDDLSTMKSYSKRLINLQEIIEQANERDFVMDVQDLRHSLTESYEMLNECRSKLRMYKNPDEIGVKYLTLSDCISQRQLKGLQNYLAINQSMMKSLDQQMDAQWSYYQDMVRRNSKHHMRVPCLDGIYQQMTKLKNLITQQQTKLHYIKSVIKQKDLGCGGRLGNDWRKDGTQISKTDGGIVSLADSILSMSINNMTDAKSNKLPQNKLNALRNFTNQQAKVTIIKPQRPNRVELTSEVILETKQLIKTKESKDKETIAANRAAEKAQDAGKEKSLTPTYKPTSSQLYPPQKSDSQQHLSKSISSIGPFAHLQNVSEPKDANFQKSLQQQQQQQSALNFSGGNLFGKMEAAKGATGTSELPKFGPNTTIIKSGVVEVKPNTVATPNKPAQMDEKTSLEPPATNFSFAAKSDNAEVGKSAPPNIFSAAAAKGGFMGFGQQTSNANSLFNNSNNIGDSANNQKPFSFGNTFSALTDLGNGTKQAAIPTQNSGGLPTPTVSSSSTTMQPTIFNKQNDKPIFGTSAISSAETSSANVVKTTNDAPKETKETKDKPTSAQTPAATNESTVHGQGDADSALLKSLNICKPTVKEAVKPKEGNVFSFNANNENNPQGAFQPMPDSKSSTITTTTTTAAAAAVTVATSASATPSLFSGKGSSTATPAFGTFSSTGLNIPTFGNTTLSSTTNIFAASATTTTATSTFGGTSAFSFSNSTLFKQVPPTFQSSTTSASTIATTTTNTTSSSISTPAATVSSITTATTSATVSSTEITTSTVVSSANLAATPSTAATAATLPTSSATGGGVATATPSTSASTIVSPTAVSSVSATNVTTSPFFSTIAATKAPGESSSFGNTGQPTPAASPNSTAPKSENVTQPQPVSNMPTFGSMSLGNVAPASGGNIFGNTSSGFGSPAGGIFGGAATAAIPTSPTTGGSIFGNAAIKSGVPSPSIFGNAANVKPAENSAGSIFGNAVVKSANTAENSGGSIFGGTPAKGAENVNIFGSPTSPNTTAAAVSSGGSIFGQSALGQSGGGNIFAAAANKSESTSSASGFSFVGSAFGSAAKNTVAPGASIFGGTAAATDSQPQQQQSSNIFGSPSSGFGGAGAAAAAATSPFSSFSQGGTSVASTGFGSPTQQPQAGGAFSRPVFGGAPTFGSPPAFGAQPSFGGAPTFGSPKGFGSFATPTTTSPFGGAPAAQGSNIFESLGSTDTGLSFGNLAQTTNNPPNAPKPIFGGSSFMNYRA